MKRKYNYFFFKENKKLNKYNFYKKKYKKIKKKLNIIIEKNIIYVSDNIGYFMLMIIKKIKFYGQKNYKIPFRSNIKINNNK